MKKLLKWLFGDNTQEPITERIFTEAVQEQYYEKKKAGLEAILGPMHDLVGHSIIPFSVGGAVDLYYFTRHRKGTAFATMELLDPDGLGPKGNNLGTYELVAFTHYDYEEEAIDEETTSDNKSPFQNIEGQARHFLTRVGHFAFEAELNPLDTIELPDDKEGSSTYLIFDVYEPQGKKFSIGDRKHHLLLCIQIHASELEYARERGSEALMKRLKEAGHYPYSDLDRAAVV